MLQTLKQTVKAGSMYKLCQATEHESHQKKKKQAKQNFYKTAHIMKFTPKIESTIKIWVFRNVVGMTI